MFISHLRQLAAAGTAAVILALLPACATTNPSQPVLPVATPSSSPSVPAQQPRVKGFPNGRSDSAEPFFRQLQLEIAADPEFGRTPLKPITTGPRERSVHRLFLNSLRGPNGEPTSYERRRACCDFKDPTLPMGGGLLDEYEIRVDGSNEVILLYVDMYRRPTPFNVFIPRGFTQRNLQEPR